MSRARRQKPSGDYEVGYGRPPREHRFKKGERKRQPTLDAIDVAEVLSRPVRAQVNGKERDVDPFEALLRRLLVQALKEGQIKALLKVINIFEKYEVYQPPARAAGGGVLDLPHTAFAGAVDDEKGSSNG